MSAFQKCCSPAIAYSPFPMKNRDAGYSAPSGLLTADGRQNPPP